MWTENAGSNAGFDAGLEASMAAWLPQKTPLAPPKHLLDRTHASRQPCHDAQVSDPVPLPSAGQLQDALHLSSLAAVNSTSKALADWMECVSLSDQHEPSAFHSDDDRKAPQGAGSSRKLLQHSGSGSAEGISNGINSARILARLSSCMVGLSWGMYCRRTHESLQRI